jgi:hypothetical protein
MTQPELLKGLAVFAIVIAAAWLSMPYADRYVASVSPDKVAIPDQPPEGAATCVESDGSYRNWPWPNAPTLSPPCPPEK